MKLTPASQQTRHEQSSPNNVESAVKYLHYGVSSKSQGGTMGTILFAAAVGGGIGALIGSAKGNTKAGFWWGFLLGPIGWIIMAVKKS